MKESLKLRTNFVEKNSQIYENNIINEESFYDYFCQEGQTVTSAFKKAHKYDQKMLKKELERVRCQLQKEPTILTFYLLSNISSHVFDGLHLHTESLNRIKDMVTTNRKARIVFMPIYKSYSDPLIMHYINYFCDLELGFTFGNYEDSPKIHFVDRLLKRIGTFLIRRNYHADQRMSPEIIEYMNQSLF